MSDTLFSAVDKISRSGDLGKRAFIVAVSGNALGKILILDETGTEYTIGRDREMSMYIDDLKVSKHHCTVKHDSGDFRISDNDSTNNTYLNSKPLKKTQVLSYGDRIIIGNTILRFFYEERMPSK